MRLIDCDEMRRRGHLKYLGGERECFVIPLTDLNDLPTVKAIPIEWIEIRAKHERRVTVKQWLEKLIKDWREEQGDDI